MRIEVSGRCSAGEVAALQEKLSAFVAEHAAAFTSDEHAYLICCALVLPPFPCGGLHLFRSAFYPHNLMFLAALPARTMGVQFALTVPEKVDGEALLTHMQERVRSWSEEP